MMADASSALLHSVAVAVRVNLPPLFVSDEYHLLASLLDETPQGILVVDADGVISYANLAMSVLFLPFRVVVGENLAEMGGLELIAWLANDAVRTRGHVEANSPFPTPAGAEPNHQRFYHATAAPWKEGGRHGVWVMVEDTTRHMMTEQIRKDFVTNASHELRTPLSLIHGYIETLRSGVIKNTTSLKHCLEVMDKHSRRMMRIIDDMLTISRLEGDSSQLNFTPFLVRGCVEDVLEHRMPLVESRQPVIMLDFPQDGGLLHGDRFYWDQIFINIIENALKENSRSGLRLKIAGKWSRNECILTVEDDGVGIRAEDVPFVFKRFYRSAKGHSQEIQGTGLGLCIVKHAVEAHGGSIELESRPGVSTVFTIRLPLQKAAP